MMELLHGRYCECGHHCLSCYVVLTGRQQKYCSEYCGKRWRAETALTEYLQAQQRS